MNTEIIKLDKDNIDYGKLKYAAEAIINGGLVAFPTETVYGLGANALDEKAVRGIFSAKGRPSDNPLIVHISEKSGLHELVREIPSDVYALMEHFWPGPLTIVLKKSEKVPSVVSAGLDTVAVRMPSHPVALELIKLAQVPVAAPSANSSGKPSPTCAEHVIEDLYGKVDMIIDAGEARVGLESTVLDMSAYPPVILRPGGVTPSQLKSVLGEVVIDPAVMAENDKTHFAPRAPGMKYAHYSPKADVIIVEGKIKNVAAKILELARESKAAGGKPGIMATEQTMHLYGREAEVISMGDRDKPETIAASIFSILRRFDELGIQVIFAEGVENTGIGLAIMNRMRKAAANRVIKV
ncbi:MAG: L-threonylcarbamoyladenylate synthase [Clostridia bacterium]|nr:L-threonylcarbamoyladenylate synthase [Clostridia bacterium]